MHMRRLLLASNHGNEVRLTGIYTYFWLTAGLLGNHQPTYIPSIPLELEPPRRPFLTNIDIASKSHHERLGAHRWNPPSSPPPLATGPGYRAYLLWASALPQGTPSPLEGATLADQIAASSLPRNRCASRASDILHQRCHLVGLLDQIAAAIAILLTMASVTSLLHEIAGKQPGLVLLGVSLLLVATNTGYYIRLIGAELFVLALAASITWLAWIPRTRNRKCSSLAGLERTDRPTHDGFALNLSSSPRPRWFWGFFVRQSRRRGQHPAWSVLCVGAPMTIGLLVVSMQLFRSLDHRRVDALFRLPLFGNDQFQSLDLTAPYLRSVTLDPQAGLPPHPLRRARVCVRP